MAQIVLGIGASHTPLLTLESGYWSQRAAVDMANDSLNLTDGRLLSYQELLEETGGRHTADVAPDVLAAKARSCDTALDRLSEELLRVRPDVVIIVGDDQRELFDANNQPVLAVYHGAEGVTLNKWEQDAPPEWIRQMGSGYLMDRCVPFPAAPDLAKDLVQGLMDHDVDVATIAGLDDPRRAGFGHAYGFVIQRLLRGAAIPVLPLLLNTYYPPNVPSARRAFHLGKALASAIAQSPLQLRIAVVASGGLTHFVVDEKLDRGLLDAFKRRDADYLCSVPREALVSGTSEILNWIVVAGAVGGLELQWSEYHPLYRTPAGTGVGAAFAIWSGAAGTP